MPRHYYSAAEYTDMILMYGECHQNAALTLRTYRERYGASRHCPTDVRTIINAVQRLRDNQPLMPNTHDGVAGQQTSSNLEQRVLTHFRNNLTCSLRQAGRTFHVHHRTIHRILKKDKVRPYKYCKVHALLPRDKPVREMYCRWVLDRIAQDQHFVRNVFWTDKSTFTRNGMWNRQTMRHWSHTNPHLIRESAHQYRFSVNVWAGIHGENIVGPFFIDGNLNAQKFLELCDGPISEYLDGLSVAANSRVWFQLDGAPPHSVLLARERLNIMFGDQWIGRFGPQRWPARSPDLTPLEFFLWGFIKNEVYARVSESEAELRTRIVDAFDKLKTMALDPDRNLLRRVRHNIVRRYNLCVQNRGGHIEHLKI